MPATPPGNSTPSSQAAGFHVWRPGRLAYRDALALQEDLVERRPGWPHDLLLLLEHPPVITLGRRAGSSHLRWTPEQLAVFGLDVVATRRGGDITLHNPGQLVGYPIVDLNRYRRDLHSYLRNLEQVLLDTLAAFGLTGRVVPGKTGVWVAERKIASIGIAVRRWVTWHGFALNINNDLSVFDAIVPCGLADVTMTSMTTELGRDIDPAKVSDILVEQFGKVFKIAYLGELAERP